MQAIYFQKNSIAPVDIPRPKPVKSEALIKIILTGICNTDLEIFKGYMSFTGIPGHEFVGEVIESENPSLIGRRIIGEINLGCGICSLCKAGDERHCANRSVLGILNKNGSFAEYITLPERNLIEIPDNIDDKTAVLIEPLAAAFQITTQVSIDKGQKILIIGDGKLGLLIATVMEGLGCRVTLLGHYPERNESLLPNIIHSGTEKEASVKVPFDLIVEASGNSEGLETAINLCRPLGKIILKSTFSGESRFDAASIVVNEITIIGSRCGRFKRAINALSSGEVKIPCGYIESIYPLSRAKEAIERAAEPGTLKILLRPGE